jgi:membrane protease YdiL (CAAX protease family)
MKTYKYKPVRFYVIVFTITWILWFGAAIISRTTLGESNVHLLLMLLGLFVPSVTAISTVLTSKSRALKHELKEKLIGFFRIKIGNVALAIIIFFCIIVVSILLSTLFGQSLKQFSFTEDFSFSIGGFSTLLLLVLTALMEEIGWRGYAEDSIGAYCSWLRESLISGSLWALWHLPLFFIPGTYQNNTMLENPWFMLNFFLGCLPLDILFAWVYVKNNRSVLACMIFHFFVNFLQERIAMTQITKCVQTFVILGAAVIVVIQNKDMFFETRHVGHLLPEEE